MILDDELCDIRRNFSIRTSCFHLQFASHMLPCTSHIPWWMTVQSWCITFEHRSTHWQTPHMEVDASLEDDLPLRTGFFPSTSMRCVRRSVQIQCSKFPQVEWSSCYYIATTHTTFSIHWQLYIGTEQSICWPLCFKGRHGNRSKTTEIWKVQTLCL